MKNIGYLLIVIVYLFSCKDKTAEINIVHNKKTERLDSLYKEHFKRLEFNGNVLVAENGNIIFQKSFGLANEKTKEKLNVNTTFELASVSKQFTAMGIVQLQKQEKLSYQDLISKYIPELNNYKNITIENLLVHTGGLPDYMNLMEENWDKSKFATNESVIKLFQELQPKKLFEAGDKFQYSNTGYLLLGTIIERVSGKSFEEYLKEKIFEPLNMDNTFVYRRRFQPKKIKNYAQGYIYSDSLKRKILPDEKGKNFYCIYLDGIVGDGMVNSNLQDLLKWDRALYSNKLISEEDKKIIFSSHKTKEDKETNYGYGWFVRQDSVYGKLNYHSGSWAGYVTFIERHTKNDKTIIILQNNSTKVTELPVRSTRNILYNEQIKKTFTLSKNTLLKYTGDYFQKNKKVDSISFEFNRLWVNKRYELKPVTKTKFEIVGVRPIVTYEFFLDKDNNVKKLKAYQKDTEFNQTLIRKK